MFDPVAIGAAAPMGAPTGAPGLGQQTEVDAFLAEIGLSKYSESLVAVGATTMQAVAALGLEDLKGRAGMLAGHARLLQKSLAQRTSATPPQAATANCAKKPTREERALKAAEVRRKEDPTPPAAFDQAELVKRVKEAEEEAAKQAEAARKRAEEEAEKARQEEEALAREAEREKTEAEEAAKQREVDQRRRRDSRSRGDGRRKSSDRGRRSSDRGEKRRNRDSRSPTRRRDSRSRGRHGGGGGSGRRSRSRSRRGGNSGSVLDQRRDQQLEPRPYGWGTSDRGDRGGHGQEPKAAPRRRRSGWDEDDGNAKNSLTPVAGIGGSLEDPRPANHQVAPSLSTILGVPGASVVVEDEPKTGFGRAAFALQIPSRWVGSIVGKSGESIKIIERSTGTVIKVDHASADGVSICRVYGQTMAADKAADMLKLKIAACAVEVGAPLPEGLIIEDYPVDRGIIGLIMGKGGETMKAIRLESGAEIVFDKSSERKGQPKFRIVGKPDKVKIAREMIRLRLSSLKVVVGGPDDNFQMRPDDIALDFTIEQKHVARIMGKNKESLKEMCDRSGARIELEQSTQDQGYSTVRIIGRREAVECAKELVMTKVKQGSSNSTTWMNGDWRCPGCASQNYSKNHECRRCGVPKPESAQPVPGWLEVAGPGEWACPTCGLHKNFASQPECRRCGGAAPHDGFQRHPGRKLPEPPPGKSAPSFLNRPTDDTILVEQKWVGFLIGPGGQSLRQIKEQSGAKLMIDQDTREQGYSCIRIGDTGSTEHKVALDLLQQKLQECVTKQGEQQQTVMPKSSVKVVLQGPAVVPPPPPPSKQQQQQQWMHSQPWQQSQAWDQPQQWSQSHQWSHQQGQEQWQVAVPPDSTAAALPPQWGLL